MAETTMADQSKNEALPSHSSFFHTQALFFTFMPMISGVVTINGTIQETGMITWDKT